MRTPEEMFELIKKVAFEDENHFQTNPMIHFGVLLTV